MPTRQRCPRSTRCASGGLPNPADQEQRQRRASYFRQHLHLQWPPRPPHGLDCPQRITVRSACCTRYRSNPCPYRPVAASPLESGAVQILGKVPRSVMSSPVSAGPGYTFGYRSLAARPSSAEQCVEVVERCCRVGWASLRQGGSVACRHQDEHLRYPSRGDLRSAGAHRRTTLAVCAGTRTSAAMLCTPRCTPGGRPAVLPRRTDRRGPPRQRR
jgi:hypothetical protein